MYKSWWNSKKVHLVHFKNKKKNPKTKRKNFFAIVKGNLKEDCDSCKKLQKKDDFEVNSILEEVQPLLAEFVDIKPSKRLDGLLVCAISNVMDVNVQVYTTSNIQMSIQIVSTRIDVITFTTVILIVQFCSKLK